MKRRTLLGGLATLPALLGGNSSDTEENRDGRGLNLNLSLENDEGSTVEVKTQNPTKRDATLTASVDTEGDYPSGRLPELSLAPGETRTTGISGTPTRQHYPNRVELTLVVEWD